MIKDKPFSLFDLDDDPDYFIFPGFNGQILKVGDVWQFWECYTCGNATASLPDRCEKCNSIKSFIFRQIWKKVRRLK